MIKLGDCGRELRLHSDSGYPWTDSMDVKVQMVIKAPRGTLTLFDQNYIMTNAQCKAIKAFMEQHSHD